MDITVKWKVSSRVEKLVDTIAQCRQELVTACFSKHGMGTKLVVCDVYAGDKPLELLKLSKMWTPAQETEPEEEDKSSHYRKQQATTHLVADFTLFKVHSMPLLEDDVIRVVATFTVPDHASPQTMFGNVVLVA